MKNMKKITLIILTGIITTLVVITLSGCGSDNHVKTLETVNTDENKIGEPHWTSVTDGLAYSSLLVPVSTSQNRELFIARINPRLFRFSIYLNKDATKAKSISDIHKEQHSLLTFNGSFFDTDFKPIGLIIKNGEKLSKLSPSELSNGIFAINSKGEPALLDAKNPGDLTRFDFALQNGPVLLDPEGDIKITVDTQKSASRTALGIDNTGNVILIVIKQTLLNSNNAMSLYQFAHLLKESPSLAALNLHSVLNLDGGPSTGVIIGKQYFPEINNVENVVTVLKKSSST